MMEYGDEGWSGVDGKRRPLRDQYRDVFFEHFGGDRLHNPFIDVADLRQHMQMVMGLIDKACVFHKEEAAALQLMQQAFANFGLGAEEVASEERSLPFKHTRLFSLFDFFAG